MSNFCEDLFWELNSSTCNNLPTYQEANVADASSANHVMEGWSTSSDSGYSFESNSSGDELDCSELDFSSLFSFNGIPDEVLSTIDQQPPQGAETYTTSSELLPCTEGISVASYTMSSQIDRFYTGYCDNLGKNDLDEGLSLSDLEISDDECDPNDTNYNQIIKTNFPISHPCNNHMQPNSHYSSIKGLPNHEDQVSYKSPRTTKQPILSHFLYHALENPREYNSMIKWVDRSSGQFEFLSKNKEKLARAWGKAKNNRCPMTYQKMSRALRIYINKRVVMKKMKRKLHYVFLPQFLEIVAATT